MDTNEPWPKGKLLKSVRHINLLELCSKLFFAQMKAFSRTIPLICCRCRRRRGKPFTPLTRFSSLCTAIHVLVTLTLVSQENQLTKSM